MLGAARNYTERVLEREPRNVPMLLLLAQIHDSRGRLEEAEASHRAALEAQPLHNQARLGLAQFLLRHSKTEEAAEQFEILRQRRYETHDVLMGLALCCKSRGTNAQERELLDTVLSESPDDVQALTERGRLKMEAQELDAAERDLRRASDKKGFD